MAITREKYDNLIARSDAREICFMFDACQCKDFFLELDNAKVMLGIGNSLWLESRIVRTIVYFLEPFLLLVTMVGGFLWLHWWGFLIALGVFVFWGLLKAVTANSIQRFVRPLIIFGLGVFLTFVFRNQGVGFVVFLLSLSLFYLTEKMLYALPVLFFSLLTPSNYDLVNWVYDQSYDKFNHEMDIPLMYHVETPGGIFPKQSVKLPPPLFLTLWGLVNKECRIKSWEAGKKD